MNLKSWEEAKISINQFLVKFFLLSITILIAISYLSYIFKFNLDAIIKIFLFLGLFPFPIYIGFSCISSYLYFNKKRGRSLWEVNWEEMNDFEKRYNVKMRKIGRAYFIYIFEIIFVFLITVFMRLYLQWIWIINLL